MALTRIASIIATALTGLTIIPALVFTFLSFRLRTFKRDPTKPWVFFLRAALVTYSLYGQLVETTGSYADPLAGGQSFTLQHAATRLSI